MELEAELGACRERCKELEWKLTRSNTSLEHQTKELSQAREALLKLQKAKAEEVKELRRAHRRELDEMIVTFEKRRSEWAPRAASKLAQAGAGGGAGAGGAGYYFRQGASNTTTTSTMSSPPPPCADPKSS